MSGMSSQGGGGGGELTANGRTPGVCATTTPRLNRTIADAGSGANSFPDLTNSCVFRPAAITVAQQERSVNVTKFCEPRSDEGKQRLQADSREFFVIGQDATMIGSPILNTRKSAAKKYARLRYMLSVVFMWFIQHRLNSMHS